jgi:hypothetical protein
MLPGYGAKTTPIPIGIAAEFWPHGQSRKVLEVAKSAPVWEARTTLLYVAMTKETHGERSKVVEHITRLPGALHVSERVDYLTYLQQVANSKFVAAPGGNGMDTHRVWEVSIGRTSVHVDDNLLHHGVASCGAMNMLTVRGNCH